MLTHKYRISRYGCLAVILSLSGTPSLAQEAYFSFQGDFNTAGDQHDFNFDLSRTVDSSETVRFVTFARNGGIRASGEVLPADPNGIDSVLELTDSTLFLHGFNDDSFGVDSQITWTQASGTPLNPDPLPIESYRLNMIEFGNNNIGPWSIDLVAPADAFTLTGSTPSGTSTVNSLKFGNFSGPDPAIFNQGATLNLTDTLVVAEYGDAHFNNTGTTTVGGVTTVNSGGTLIANAGTFNANDNVNINGGTINANISSFSFASGKTLAATNNAQLQTNGNLFLDSTKTINLSSGADMTHTGQLTAGTINGSGTITVNGSGSTLTQNGPLVISQQGGTGTVTIENNAMLQVNGSTLLSSSFTAPTNNGELNVLTGAEVTANSVFIGNNDGDEGTGTLTVDGTGSTVIQNGTSTLTVGNTDTPNNNGNHTIFVQNSAAFTTGTGNTTINKTGTVNINTSGTFNANGNVSIDGGSLTRNSGTFNLAAGKTLTASNDGQVGFTGDYAIANGSTFTINSGADLSSDSYIDIGNGSNGTLIVDGIGSTLTTDNESSWWGSGGATANITLRNEATANLDGLTLQIGRSSTAGTVGTVNIQSQAGLTANEIQLGAGGSTGGSATITIDGSGSSLTQNGASTLTVGHTSEGSANINLTNGGQFTTGTGVITINKTGTLDIKTGGTFNANGNVDLIGGTLTRDSNSTFALTAGKYLTASDDAQVTLAGFSNFQVKGGSKLEVYTGADFNTGGVSVGDTTTGTLIVDGAGSTLNITSSSSGGFGENGGSADVTISSGATMTGGSNWYMQNGSFTVDGNGSSATQGGGALLSIGSNSGGVFELNVRNNAIFTTGFDYTEVINDGTVNIQSNATFDVLGQFRIENGGTVNLGGGTLSAGFVNHTNGGSFNFYSGTLHVDTFLGFLDQQGGTLAPGNSPGITEITNGYFNNGGTIQIELDGLTAGTDFDQVQVTGNAHLGAGSALDVLFSNSFTYMKGDSMVILQADSLTGAFNSVSFASNPGAAMGLVYSATSVTLLAGLPGDLNTDGFVGIEDLNIVLGNWNQNVTAGVWLQGDPNGDGFIGIEDLNVVLGNWNAGTPPPPLDTAIPEPATLALLTLGSVTLLRRSYAY